MSQTTMKYKETAINTRVVDYLTLLQPANALASNLLSTIEVYNNKQGVRFYCNEEKERGVREVVSFHDDIILLSNRCTISAVSPYLVSQGDWIHMQFIVKGAARERIGHGEFIDMPEQTCIVFRQPENQVITQDIISGSMSWSVCLLIRPKTIASLLGMKTSDFPGHLEWMMDEGKQNPQWRSLPIHCLALMAIESIFSCPFKNKIRAAYMYAKIVELVSIVIGGLCGEVGHFVTSKRLSIADTEKISVVRSIMETELDTPASLHELARRSGINRTKLAVGFKSLYGVPVQEYWRDLRLVRARELLLNECLQVTEVAPLVGYADIASFSRAFSRKFGVAPKYFRGDDAEPFLN